MDLDFKKRPHGQDHLGLTSETIPLTHGKVLFCSWICQGCGTRMENRRIYRVTEVILLTRATKVGLASGPRGSLRRDPSPIRNRTNSFYSLFGE